MSSSDLKDYLEHHLMLFYPERYLSKFVSSTRDIYNNRQILKSITYNDAALNYLLDLIMKDRREKIRFRKLECLKVIRAIIRNKASEKSIEKTTISKLFNVYMEFIFDKNEELQWCISTFIKDQKLEEEELKWLISNYKKSNFIINRLLRYPSNNELLRNWAQSVYSNKELGNRASEVVALLIDKDISPFVKECDPEILIWGIYYARISDEVKQELLKEHGPKSLQTTVEICERLGYPAVIEFMLQGLTK